MSETALKVETGLLKLPCVNNALLSVPVWEERRAKNWLAVINVDGTKPGGLDRRWMPRARGDCFYMVEQLSLFDPVEFGADRLAWSGNQVQNRWYGVVVEKTDSYLLVEPVDPGEESWFGFRCGRRQGHLLGEGLWHPSRVSEGLQSYGF